MKLRPKMPWTILILICAFATVPAALASLGSNEGSIESDRQALNGTSVMSTQKLYKVHEISSKTHDVHEYETLKGVVFAVTWKGLTHPRLDTLFGSYYGEYQDAEKKTPIPRGRAIRTITSRHLIVERGGHMRAVLGRAYIPSLIPSGVDLKDLQ